MKKKQWQNLPVAQVFKTQPAKPQKNQNSRQSHQNKSSDYKFTDKKQSTNIPPWSVPKKDNMIEKRSPYERNLQETTPHEIIAQEITPPANHIKIPVDQLLIMYTTQTKHLLKLEDKITYKCETLSLETYSPVISGLRNGTIIALDGRKITINRIIPLAQKNVESVEEGEEEDENDVFFLHNFKELWIDQSCLDEIRKEEIEKMNLIEASKQNMLKELENRNLPKEIEITAEKQEINEKKENFPVFEEKLTVPEEKRDILTIERMIGNQVNINIIVIVNRIYSIG